MKVYDVFFPNFRGIKIETRDGIKVVDEKAPEEDTVLFYGTPKSGKSLLAYQFMLSYLAQNKDAVGIVITSEEYSSSKVMERIEMLAKSVAEHFNVSLESLIERVVPILLTNMFTKRVLRIKERKMFPVFYVQFVMNVVRSMKYYLKNPEEFYKNGKCFLIVDSFTALCPLEQIMRFIFGEFLDYLRSPPELNENFFKYNVEHIYRGNFERFKKDFEGIMKDYFNTTKSRKFMLFQKSPIIFITQERREAYFSRPSGGLSIEHLAPVVFSFRRYFTKEGTQNYSLVVYGRGFNVDRVLYLAQDDSGYIYIKEDEKQKEKEEGETEKEAGESQ